MTVFFISGLGVDRSIFKHIKLPPGYTSVYLDWIEPTAAETLLHYESCLAQKIDATTPYALVVLSFGGMIAVEIAKEKKPRFLIIISSVATMRHLPAYYRMAGRLRLHRAVPVWLIQRAALLKRYFTSESQADKKDLKAMIRRIDARFIKWAMHAILTWENTSIPEQLVHIHGTHDEILPKRFTKPTHLVANGRHLMVLTRAQEINKILFEVFTGAAKRDNEVG